MDIDPIPVHPLSTFGKLTGTLNTKTCVIWSPFLTTFEQSIVTAWQMYNEIRYYQAMVFLQVQCAQHTLRNDDVVIMPKRRHLDVITSKWRRFDVTTTLSLRQVFGGWEHYSVIKRTHIVDSICKRCIYYSPFQDRLVTDVDMPAVFAGLT